MNPNTFHFNDLMARFGGRKFIVCLIGLLIWWTEHKTGVKVSEFIDPAGNIASQSNGDLSSVLMLCGSYIFGQGVSDAFSGGATSSVTQFMAKLVPPSTAIPKNEVQPPPQ